MVQRCKSPISIRAEYLEEIGNLAVYESISLKLKDKLKMFSSIFLDICNEKRKKYEYIRVCTYMFGHININIISLLVLIKGKNDIFLANHYCSLMNCCTNLSLELRKKTEYVHVSFMHKEENIIDKSNDDDGDDNKTKMFAQYRSAPHP